MQSVLPLTLFAQQFNVNLSPSHQQKLSTIESGHKRMVKYYRYYKKDSARLVKRENKKKRLAWDSTFKAQKNKQKLERKLAKQGIEVPKELSVADSLTLEIDNWYSILKDSTSSDSLKQIAKVNIKVLAISKARQYPGYQHLEEQYKLYGDSSSWGELVKQVPGLDSLKDLFQSNPKDLFAHSEKYVEAYIKKLGGAGALGGEFQRAEALKNLPGQYKEEYSAYMDKEKLTEEGKQKAVEKATDFLVENAEQLGGAQAKVSKLLSKYKEFSNSVDLKDAKKQTSLEDKSFFERIELGGTFNVLSTDPFSIDLSPQLGYKFSTRFTMGIGMNYRQTFGDSINSKWQVSPVNTGFKVFANYDVIKSFYAYTEVERSGVEMKVDDKVNREWINNYFIGAGRKFLIHPKVYMTVTALYNLNGDDNNPVYPRRFQLRIGFKSSELSHQKKKINYDPNR